MKRQSNTVGTRSKTIKYMLKHSYRDSLDVDTLRAPHLNLARRIRRGINAQFLLLLFFVCNRSSAGLLFFGFDGILYEAENRASPNRHIGGDLHSTCLRACFLACVSITFLVLFSVHTGFVFFLIISH